MGSLKSLAVNWLQGSSPPACLNCGPNPHTETSVNLLVSWSRPFAEMAREYGIAADMTKHLSLVEQFFSKLNM
jgi:hypothetical protein